MSEKLDFDALEPWQREVLREAIEDAKSELAELRKRAAESKEPVTPVDEKRISVRVV